MAWAMVYRYELWRLRCTEVMRVERPAKERCLLEEVGRLRERITEVRANDRGLFEERNIPKEGDDLARMKEWVRSVQGSIERSERIERATHRNIGSYFGRRGAERSGSD